MARQRRAAARAAAASIRTPSGVVPELSDEEMADVVGAPSPSSGVQDEDEANEDEETEEVATPAPSEPTSRPATPQTGRPSVIPRKRRFGRPPRHHRQDDDEDGNTPSDIGTPKRGRGRGRPGGRWAKVRGGPAFSTQVPIDKEGNMMDVIDDEVALPEDPEGEEKVDKMGNLKGGRDYRVRVFTVADRGDRLYMLSTEPARCIGFRDSYLFFQKHKTLFKIIISDHEKRDLIDREIIPHSYKGRSIGIVTARSVFREFGARIIVGGRRIFDDYQVQAARANGEIEGELAVPEDRLPPLGEPYNKNQYVAWHGASAVYHSGAPSVPLISGKMADVKKKRPVVTGDNWMLEHCKETIRFNREIAAVRAANLNGVYNIHTNVMEYPKIMQPTHVRWEEVLEDSIGDLAIKEERAETTNGEVAPNGVMNGVSHKQSAVFPSLKPAYSKRFMIHDACYESAPYSGLGIPGPDGDNWDIGGNGLSSIRPEILAELPPECRKAFDEALEREMTWKQKWRNETTDGHRGVFASTYLWAG